LEAEGSPNLTEINGKFIDVSNAEENKWKKKNLCKAFI
jgi:hypothetical protein